MAASTLPSAAASPRPAGRLRRFWDSSVGKKTVMAVSGISGIAFVFVHMAGNLQMFKPVGAAPAMHDYAVALRKLGALLWVARLGLLASVSVHVVAAWQLTMRNRAARPVAYARRHGQTSTLGARTMRIGGVVLLAFIVFHIADMTFGVGHPGFTHLDPYNNLRLGFTRWWATAFYVIATVFLGLHLYHGAWSSWRTLGARRPSPHPLHRPIAVVLAVVIAVGLAAVPIAAALGAFPEAAVPLEMDASVLAAPTGPALPPGGGR
ncbi:MAG: succinate dehydrogenase cytochrome b subunit [Gemmatimonadaceae bacterium]|nr:succinate dehydrogenase cytochrome b subunit [Gemmatimonadaceae bacterium]